MAIQDSDPERRNLMVTSIAFITYFFSGGQLADDVVRLQIVNIKFTYPAILASLAWTLLLWFAYRYWLTHSGYFTKYFQNEVAEWSSKRYFDNYLSIALNSSISQNNEGGWHLQEIYWKKRRLVAKCIFASNVHRKKQTGRIQSYSQAGGKEAKEIVFSGPRGWILTIRLLAECFFLKPSFSSYIVPYLLFWLAVIGGIFSVASNLF